MERSQGLSASRLQELTAAIRPHTPRREHTWAAQGFPRWGVDAAALLGLAVVAGALARTYASTSLFAWGDHPGQFMRFWQALTQGMPASGHWLWGVLSWYTGWYAGYPELQFYPPGATLLGLLLNGLTLGRLPAEQVYNLIPAIALCLPLFTCYVFLRVTLAPLGHIPAALAGITAGLLAISFKPMWGGIDAVAIGLLGERLAFGFAPLVLLAGWRLVERPGATRLAVAAVTLACLLLLHPFHAPALVLATALYALLSWVRQWPWRTAAIGAGLVRSAVWLAGWVVLAAGLVAWWMLPLAQRYSPYAAALVRATPDQILGWLDAGEIEWLWLAALMALFLLPQRRPPVDATVGTLALCAPLLVGGILFNDRVLLARQILTTFDPIRGIAEYYLVLILLAGCAVAAVTSRDLWRIPWLAAVCTLTLLITLPPYVGQAWRDLRDHLTVAPTAAMVDLLQHPAFTGYWDALRQDPAAGRVLFTSHYLHLQHADGRVTPTTLNSLTPYLTGQEIVGGTFSHWSPVARWLWVGDPGARLLPAQVEHGDHRQFFGVPWSQLSGDVLADYLRRLNVTTVVTEAADIQARAVLDASPHFKYHWQNDYFMIYHVADTRGWLEADGAVVELVERSPRRWVVQVHESATGTTVRLKLSYYPLWRGRAARQSIPICADQYGLQEATLPPGGPYRLEVVYREGWPEWIGLFLSLGCLGWVGWQLGTGPLVLMVRSRPRRAPQTPTAPRRPSACYGIRRTRQQMGASWLFTIGIMQ